MKKHYVFNGPFEMKDEQGNKYTLTIKRDNSPESPRSWDNVCTMICFHRRYDLGDKHPFDNSDEFFEYILCDICNMKYEDIEELSTREKYKLACENDKVYIQELNLYDHSGITISTSSNYPYNDPWNAGCVGWIYVSKEKALEQWGGIPERDENGELIRIPHNHPDGNVTYSIKYIPITEENWKEVAKYHMDNEVKTYDQYLTNDVYGYELTKTVFEQEKCPHCGEVINEYETDEEMDNCWGFFGYCLEENGILDNISSELSFVE
jgi:hypothetical protein